VLGHVDHGKSSILDAIRETNIIATEAGAITQAIGASLVPLDAIRKRCGPLLDQVKGDFDFPGLLFIDTPGHAAFTSLRKRGGAMADIAILVVDITEGFQPQTEEAVEILKQSGTPFIIAANKVDLVPGYERHEQYFMRDLKEQSTNVQQKIDTLLYELVGDLHEVVQMPAERFDRVDDYTKQVAIVPCSAVEGIGIPELLMVVTGVAQRYLGDRLKVDVDGPARGSILEVKEEQGMGTTLDVILYDGTLDVDDRIVIGGLHQPIVTKVRALLEPAPMSEMRDKKGKFRRVDHVSAATGVKIVAPGLDDALAGMPVWEIDRDEEAVTEEVQRQVESVMIDTGEEGIIVKADSIGSLEALLQILREEEIPVAKASVGDVTKKDIAAAKSSREKNDLHGAILGFNVTSSVSPDMVKVITGDIIYRLVDALEDWQDEQQEAMEQAKLEHLNRPFKVQYMRGYTFRQNNPAVVGVQVMQGIMKVGSPLMTKDGTPVGMVKSIQLEQENISKSEAGQRVAISIPGVTTGRQIEEGDILYSGLSDDEFRKLKKLRDYLREDEIEVMKEIAEMKRKENPLWGV
jgi:translation initiation factor 5B